MIDLAVSDDSDDDNCDTTGTSEDIQDRNGSRGTERRGDNTAPITDWEWSDEAPPGWRTKTIPLTPDATNKAVHEAIERVARKIDPNSYATKLTASRSRHILASIIRNYDRRRELLYIRHRTSRASRRLEYLEMSITHTDVDDNPIPITFDLTLILLVHHITNTYSPIIQDWLECILTVDRQYPSAIEPLLDLSAFSYDRHVVELMYGAAEESMKQKTPPKFLEVKQGAHSTGHRPLQNTIQVGPPGKSQRQAQNRTQGKMKKNKYIADRGDR